MRAWLHIMFRPVMNALTRAMGLLTVVVVLASACRTAAPVPSAAPAGAQGCTLPPNAPAASAGFTEFANYSWTLFQALNWPVVTGQRGVADCGRPLGSAGPTVWESYKTVEQIFLPNAVDPGPWNSGGAQPMRLTYRSKAPDQLPLEAAIAQAVGGWLIDRQANPTYYHVAVNETSYQYVRDNRYYDANVLNLATRVQFGDGALEVKGAWRIVQGAETSRYHTAAAQVMTFDANGQPTGQYKSATVGLVGFHIVATRRRAFRSGRGRPSSTSTMLLTRRTRPAPGRISIRRAPGPSARPTSRRWCRMRRSPRPIRLRASRRFAPKSPR